MKGAMSLINERTQETEKLVSFFFFFFFSIYSFSFTASGLNCSTWALECWGSVVVAHRLSYP